MSDHACSGDTVSPRGQTIDAASCFGADNTGSRYAATEIQAAINAAQAGDTVLIPDGTYLLNESLELKSHLTLVISTNATLQANTKGDWSSAQSPMLHANRLENVCIRGGGIIDGGGLVYERGPGNHPGNAIKISACKNMTIRGLRINNIPGWAVHLQHSAHLVIDSLVLRGKGYQAQKGSADGIDIDGCSFTQITNCDIEVGDDAICIKTVTDNPSLTCHDIIVRNCVLASTCNAFKIGTETMADIYNIIADGITVNKHSWPGKNNGIASNDCISAISIQSNDHHSTRAITCRNFTINSCYCPAYIALQNRQTRSTGAIGRLENIHIENIDCRASVMQPIIINWQPGEANTLKHVSLQDIFLHNYGTAPGDVIRGMEGEYPDAHRHGVANAYGLWARGVQGLAFDQLYCFDKGNSGRKMLFLDDTVERQ